MVDEHVYDLLIAAGLQRITIPATAKPNEPSTFVFANRADFRASEKLLVLIHGSGVVRAGQWARRLIINNSLRHGTQLPYIERALELGYDVLVLNTNDNRRNGVAIPNSASPEQHAEYVWQQLVLPSPARVAIVAHSYGGIVTQRLAQRFGEHFAGKVFAVGFTDSVHSGGTELLQRLARNWVTSKRPLNEALDDGGRRSGVATYSAGHEVHEFTSWSCMEPLFEFLEQRFGEDRVSKGDRTEL